MQSVWKLYYNNNNNNWTDPVTHPGLYAAPISSVEGRLHAPLHSLMCTGELCQTTWYRAYKCLLSNIAAEHH